MGLLTKLFRSIVLTMLIVGLSGLAISISVYRVLGTPDNLRNTLNRGEVYTALSDDISRQIINKIIEVEPSIKRQIIERAVKLAITPEVLRRSGDKIIRIIYFHLENSSHLSIPEKDFSAEILSRLKSNLGQVVAHHVSELPVCSLDQLRIIDTSTSTNIFSLPCRPSSLDINAERQHYEQNIEKQFNNPANNQLIFPNSKQLAVSLKTVRKLPWIFIGLSVITGLIVIATSRKGKKIKSILITLLISGIIIAIAYLTTYVLAGKLVSSLPETTQSNFEATATAITHSLHEAINETLIVFAATYTTIGLVGIIVLNRKHNQGVIGTKP